MTHRGPLDFLAALVVEFGGLVLLLGAIPLLSASGERRQTAVRPSGHSFTTQPPVGDASHYVETRLERRSEQLVQGLMGHIEQVLDERSLHRQPDNHIVSTGVSQAAPQLPSMTASTSAAAQPPYDVR